MDEIIIQVLLFILTITFLSIAVLMRKTRLNMEHRNMRNTTTMLRVRDMIQGKIRKFRH